MTKRILECEYCHQIITENNLRCPNCGASCSEVIKKYKEEQIAHEKELQAKKEEENAKTRKLVEKSFKRITRFSLVPFIIITIVAIIIITISISSFTNILSDNPLIETIISTPASDNYKITIDSYEEYAYYDDFFKDKCNTKDGYQKIAFYFTIENISNDTVSTSKIINNISLKADNVIVSQSNLTEDTTFCELIQGKNNYSKLTQTNLASKDSVSGYLGFEVPVSAEKLKFTIDDITIEIDNPV